MGFYTAIAAVYGAICYTFVRLFAFLLLFAAHLSLQLGVWVENGKEVNKLALIWPEPSFMNLSNPPDLTAASWSQSIAAVLVYLSVLFVVGLVVSFIISFYFSANTIIYALMRNRVDGTALEDIYTPFEGVGTESAVTEPNSEELQSQPDSDTQTDSPSSAQ